MLSSIVDHQRLAKTMGGLDANPTNIDPPGPCCNIQFSASSIYAPLLTLLRLVSFDLLSHVRPESNSMSASEASLKMLGENVVIDEGK